MSMTIDVLASTAGHIVELIGVLILLASALVAIVACLVRLRRSATLQDEHAAAEQGEADCLWLPGLPLPRQLQGLHDLRGCHPGGDALAVEVSFRVAPVARDRLENDGFSVPASRAPGRERRTICGT